MNDPRAPHDLPSPGAYRAGAAGDRGATAPTGVPRSRVPVVAESIDVEKVEVDRGGYRITKRVEARDVLVDEPLRHETVDDRATSR